METLKVYWALFRRYFTLKVVERLTNGAELSRQERHFLSGEDGDLAQGIQREPLICGGRLAGGYIEPIFPGYLGT